MRQFFILCFAIILMPVLSQAVTAVDGPPSIKASDAATLGTSINIVGIHDIDVSDNLYYSFTANDHIIIKNDQHIGLYNCKSMKCLNTVDKKYTIFKHSPAAFSGRVPIVVVQLRHQESGWMNAFLTAGIQTEGSVYDAVGVIDLEKMKVIRLVCIDVAKESIYPADATMGNGVIIGVDYNEKYSYTTYIYDKYLCCFKRGILAMRLYCLEGYSMVKISPDGKNLLVVTDENKIEIYDIKTKKLLTVINDGGEEIVSLTYNKKGTIIAGIDTNGTIRCWDAVTYQIKNEYSVSGHWDKTVKRPDKMSLEFCNNDNILIVSSGALTAWNVTLNKQISIIFEHKPDNCVFNARVNDSGTMIACHGIFGGNYLLKLSKMLIE